MTREHNAFQVVGVSDESQVERPEWYDIVVNDDLPVVNVREWGREHATVLDLCNISYGHGDDTSQHELVDDRRMVITADEEEPISIVSDRYNLIQNQTVARALADVMDNFQVDGIGEVRDYKDKAVIDFYPVHGTTRFQNPDTEDHLAAGHEIRISHDRTSSVKVRPIVRDGFCRNTIRGIADWRRLSHFKSEKDGEELIEQTYNDLYEMIAAATFDLGYLSEMWLSDVRDALEVDVDFADKDYGVDEFYKEWLSGRAPDKVVQAAARRAYFREGVIDGMDEPRPENGASLSVWAIVSGFTYAYTHESGVTDGTTKDWYNRQANDALTQPKVFASSVTEAVEREDDEEADEVDVSQRAAELEADSYASQ